MYQEIAQKKFDALKHKRDVVILGIETSCDETAAALVLNGRRLLSNVISSQIELHRKFGGVVPEVASRNHTLAINAVVNEALAKAGIRAQDLDAIAVTYGAGLAGALLVGVSYAKAMAYALGLPLIRVNHIEAHICANFIRASEELGVRSEGRRTCQRAGTPDAEHKNNGLAQTIPSAIPNSSLLTPNSSSLPTSSFLLPTSFPIPHSPSPIPPFLAVAASGGHTGIIEVRDYHDYRLIGGTVDDAIGEAFDKVARLLSLPYPGGPEIDRLSKLGKPVINFYKHSKGVDKDLRLSYSGLKTAVVNYINTAKMKGEVINVPDVCASFTRQAVDLLVDTAVYAAKERGYDTIVLAGGVAANGYLRERLDGLASAGRRPTNEELGIRSEELRIDFGKSITPHSSLLIPHFKIFYPPPVLCTDNAAMVASRAYFSILAGEDLADLHLNAESGLQIKGEKLG